jgi:hypothetical protein
MEDLQANDVSLLTLPRCDLASSSNSKDGPAAATTNKEHPSLLLLQLPVNWKVQDLVNARFVVPSSRPGSGKAPTASLVVEGSSSMSSDPKEGDNQPAAADACWQLHRVETSNALVLVPPTASSDSHTQQMLRKRRKLTAGSGLLLQAVPARLLHQGAGASFLQGQIVPLALQELHTLLPVWDPREADNTTSAAPTVATLGNALPASRPQVRRALRALHALELPAPNGDDDEASYVRLAEESRLEVLDACLAALTEGEDYATAFAPGGVHAPSLISEAVVRLPVALQASPSLASLLVRHCLAGLVVDGDVNESSSTTLVLDVAKVGAAVASRILPRSMQAAAAVDFLATWQGEMPGVAYKVQTNWLVGTAVRDETTSTSWKYLPAQAIVASFSRDPAALWQHLVQVKAEWTLRELEPYLQHWESYTGQASTKLLYHAGVRTEPGSGPDGLELKIYHAR